MQCEECQTPLWKAGEVVPAGAYVRVDDGSYRTVTLELEGPLPSTFDGHVALYGPAACAYMRVHTVNRFSARLRSTADTK